MKREAALKKDFELYYLIDQNILSFEQWRSFRRGGSRSEEKDPFLSLRTCITTHSRDWSTNKQDAWLYGVVVGWGFYGRKTWSLRKEFTDRFRWTSEHFTELDELNLIFNEVWRKYATK